MVILVNKSKIHIKFHDIKHLELVNYFATFIFNLSIINY